MNPLTKMAIIILIMAGILGTIIALPKIIPPKLSAAFYMVQILGGVMVEGTVKNTGLGVARNVSIHFTFYDYQESILMEWTKILGDIGPNSERQVQLRFRIDARSFTWKMGEQD